MCVRKKMIHVSSYTWIVALSFSIRMTSPTNSLWPTRTSSYMADPSIFSATTTVHTRIESSSTKRRHRDGWGIYLDRRQKRRSHILIPLHLQLWAGHAWRSLMHQPFHHRVSHPVSIARNERRASDWWIILACPCASLSFNNNLKIYHLFYTMQSLSIKVCTV